MNACEAIQLSLDSSQFVALTYLSDLKDEDLFVRPHPACNHIAWQLGHLISSEHQMIEAIQPGSMPPLPEGFAARYTKEAARSDDRMQFDTKEMLLKQFEIQRKGTLAALQGASPAKLAEPGPEAMRDYAPTVADVFSLQGGHWMMHAGQWVVVRRKLGLPVVI